MKKTMLALSLCMLGMSVSAQVNENDLNQKATNVKYKGNEGSQCAVEVGYGFGESDKTDVFSVNALYGYKFSPYIFAGVGVGARFLTNIKDSKYAYEEAFIKKFAFPIFVDFNANFMPTKTTPFFDMKLGYSPIEIVGFHAEVAVGCRIALYKDARMFLMFGGEIQNGDRINSYEKSYANDANNVFLRIGFSGI